MWFERFLEEDIGFGDITSELLLSDEDIFGMIFVKERCVLAGLEEVEDILDYYSISYHAMASDGDRLEEDSDVLEVRGRALDILKLERTLLNILGHLSGVATRAADMVNIARKENPQIIVAVTRKTTPGLRMLEKKAAMIGGADTHRLRLDDHILIKDNHIAAVGSIEKAMERAKQVSFVRKIEIEVETPDDALKAAENGADIVMLDNMSPEEAKKAYEMLKNEFPQVLVEVSGGIDERNIGKYAKYADIISSGSITHSVRAIDFSLEAELS